MIEPLNKPAATIFGFYGFQDTDLTGSVRFTFFVTSNLLFSYFKK
jgi:hypothetical protein